MKTDTFTIRTDSLKRTDQGYLSVKATVTRTGIFKYYDADGNVINEFRPSDEVFKQDSLDTLKNIPVTSFHPKIDGKNVLLDSRNTAKFARGFTGTRIERVDGAGDELVEIPLIVTDEQTIQDIENGVTKEVSCGYTCNSEQGSGEHNGIKYDSIQKNIKYNHVAVVPRGRAGSSVKVKLDALRFDSSDQLNNDDDNLNNRSVSMQIDGKKFDVDDVGELLINQKLDELTEVKTDNEKKQKQLDELQGKYDELADKVKNLESVDHVAVAKQRLDFENQNKKFLGNDFKFDGLTELDIKKAVVEKVRSVKLDDKTEGYVAGRYDAILEDQQNGNTVADDLRNTAASAVKRLDDVGKLDQGIADMLSGNKK